MTSPRNHRAKATDYVRYRVNPYKTRMPIFWWVHRFAHIRFITRELTSVAVALYSMILLLFVRASGQGPEAYEEFLTFLRTPVSIVLHGIALLFALFHSITWLSLAPKALVLKLGRRRIPDVLIIAGNFAGWIACSALMAWLIMTL